MSQKAARGTKRVCQNCGSKFYDLNHDPIICPVCQTVFQLQNAARPKAALVGNAVEDDEDEVIATPAAAGVEIVSLDEVAEAEADLPDLEDNELVEIEEDAAELEDEDETFIAVEEDDDGDEVTGIVGGPRDDDDEV